MNTFPSKPHTIDHDHTLRDGATHVIWGNGSCLYALPIQPEGVLYTMAMVEDDLLDLGYDGTGFMRTGVLP